MKNLQEYQNLSVAEIVRNFNEIKEKLNVKGFEFKDGQSEKDLSKEFFEHAQIVNMADLFLILSKHNIEQILDKIDQDLLVFALFANVDVFVNETVIDILTAQNFNCSCPKLLVSMIDRYIYEDKLYVVSNAEMKKQKETLVELREQFNKKNQELLIENSASNDKSSLTEEFSRHVLSIKRLNSMIIEFLSEVCLRGGQVTVSDLVNEFKEILGREKRLLSSYERQMSDPNVGIINGSDAIDRVLSAEKNEVEKVLSYTINRTFLDKKADTKYVFRILSKAISPKFTQVDESEKLINLFDLDVVELDIDNLELLSSHEALLMLKFFKDQMSRSGNSAVFDEQLIKFVQSRSVSFFNEDTFSLMLTDPTWLDLFIDYNFESIYGFIEKQVCQCRAYHFCPLFRELESKQKTGKALTLFEMFYSASDQDKLARALPVMFNFYIVSERLKTHTEHDYKLARLNDVFKKAGDIYFSVFEEQIHNYISDILNLWVEKKNLNIENLNDVKLAINDSCLIKRLAKQIANKSDDYKIKAECLTSVIKDSLIYDFDKILCSSNNVVYYDILDKMKFLNMNNVDLIADKNITDEQKTVFIFKQLLCYFIYDDVAKTLQKKNSKELCEIDFTPVFSEQVIARICETANFEDSDNVNISFISKVSPIRFNLTLADFVKFTMLVKEDVIFSKLGMKGKNQKRKTPREYEILRKRENIEDLLISLLARAVKDQKIGRREFLEKNSEYDIPIFNKLNKKYLFLEED